MGPPRRSEEQFVFLGLNEGANLLAEGLKVLVRERRLPELSAVRVVGEFPEMYDLVHGANITEKVPYQPAVMQPFKGWPSQVLVNLNGFGNLADIKDISPKFVNRQCAAP